MDGSKAVSPRQRAELQKLGLPDLHTYPCNLAAINFATKGSAKYAPTADSRVRIFLAGYHRWNGKDVVDRTGALGVVQSIRVRGTYALFQCNIRPDDHANIFEVYVAWKNGSRPSCWIGVTQLKVLS